MENLTSTLSDSLLFIGFFLGGALLLTVIIVLNRIRKKRMQSWVLVNATVVDVISRRGHKGRQLYHPVFQYNDQQNKLITSQVKIGTNLNLYRKGMQEQLYYDPNNSERHMVKNNRGLKAMSIVFGIVGSLFFLIGLVAILFIFL